MMVAGTERDIVEKEASALRDEGYEVFVEPNKSITPAFLKNYVPDILAQKNDGGIIVEVKRKSDKSVHKLDDIARLFEGQAKWKLRVVWIEPSSERETLPVQEWHTIIDRIGEVEKMSHTEHVASAFLLGWATFEALSRALDEQEFRRPQTPGRLIEFLARDGYLTPDEAKEMRRLATLRNSLIHGNLKAQVGTAELSSLVEVLKELSSQH
jgi:uncharacterized protein YutE (UPF0331/DUF86 family)